MSIEQQIEELRAELRACIDSDEFAVIEQELQAALAARRRLAGTFEGVFKRLE